MLKIFGVKNHRPFLQRCHRSRRKTACSQVRMNSYILELKIYYKLVIEVAEISNDIPIMDNKKKKKLTYLTAEYAGLSCNGLG